MVDIQSISAGLKQNKDGIWFSENTEEVSYPSEGNQACFSVEENSFWFKHRNNCIVTIARNYPPKSNKAIFDIGGGNGFVSMALVDAGFDVVLVEPGDAGAAQAKARGLENVICATTHTAKFIPGSMPAAGLFDVIEHIEDDLVFLKALRPSIEAGGRVYLTVPAYSFLWSDEDVSAGHYRRYTLEQIEGVLMSAGFEIEFSSYIFRFLPLPVYLLRTLPYKLSFSKAEKSPDQAARDHAVAGGMKKNILDSLLRSEISILSRNKSMKFGGSCLVVARNPVEA